MNPGLTEDNLIFEEFGRETEVRLWHSKTKILRI